MKLFITQSIVTKPSFGGLEDCFGMTRSPQSHILRKVVLLELLFFVNIRDGHIHLTS